MPVPEPIRYQVPAVALAYRRKFDQSATRRWSHRREMAMLARALKRVGAFGRILDLPCGAGRLTPTLARCADEMVCVDLAAPMLEQARDALRGLPPPRGGLWFARGSAFALPFADRSFDVVVCWRLIQHLRDPAERAQVLRELARVSRYAVIVSFSDADTMRARLARWNPLARRRSRVTLHRRALRTELAAAGLDPVKFDRLASFFSVVAAAVCHVQNPAGSPA